MLLPLTLARIIRSLTSGALLSRRIVRLSTSIIILPLISIIISSIRYTLFPFF
jgi:hypothetical protein